MDLPQLQALLLPPQVRRGRLCFRAPQGRHAPGARPQDRARPRRHVGTQVQGRPPRLPGGAQVRAARRLQAAREHADALGAGQARASALPRDRRDHLRRRGAARDRAGLRRAVGHDVGDDAPREARPQALQAHAVPAVRRRGAAARLRRQPARRRPARGGRDGARRGRGRRGRALAVRRDQAAAVRRSVGARGRGHRQRALVQVVAPAARRARDALPPRGPAAVRRGRPELLLPLQRRRLCDRQGPQHRHPRGAQVRAPLPRRRRPRRRLERVQRHQQARRARAHPLRVQGRVPAPVHVEAAQGRHRAVPRPRADVHQGRRPGPPRLLLRPAAAPDLGVQARGGRRGGSRGRRKRRSGQGGRGARRRRRRQDGGRRRLCRPPQVADACVGRAVFRRGGGGRAAGLLLVR